MADATESVNAVHIRKGDVVLNVNGWWEVIETEVNRRGVTLRLGKQNRYQLQHHTFDDFVTRLSRAA